MFHWLRRKLFLDNIAHNTVIACNEVSALRDELHNEMGKLQHQINILLPGLGRVIAKLDPMYGKSEHDPARKAESDRLGEEIIKRLIADNAARKHTLGES